MTRTAEQDQQVLDARRKLTTIRVREALMSGQTFLLRAASHRSRYGYMPPISRRQWAGSMEQVAEMAKVSDAMAAVATRIRINLYGDAAQAGAAIWDAIATAVLGQYVDVVGRSAPDASGPPSRYQRDYTLAERVLLVAWGERIAAPYAGAVPGVGWAVEAIAAEEGVTLPGI